MTMIFNKKRLGYTIAEAVVVMAVVGIVASLVIPTFISSYRKNVLASSLSKSVSDFEKSMSIMTMKDGASSLFETRAWLNIEDANPVLSSNSSNADIEEFAKDIGTTLNLTVDTSNKKVSDFYAGIDVEDLMGNSVNISSDNLFPDMIPFVAKNGAAYFIHIPNKNNDPNKKTEREVLESGGNLSELAAYVTIDVNGTQRPNIIGRDIFEFYLGADGIMYPSGGIDSSIYFEENHIDPQTACINNNNGYRCAAYLMENGYKMNY